MLRSESNKQRGFTLIEVAIVMVIIGILMGAILRGQEMIKNAKDKISRPRFASLPQPNSPILTAWLSTPEILIRLLMALSTLTQRLGLSL